MRKITAKLLGTVAFLVGLSLGVVPLAQWFFFDHASGPIRIIFRHPSEPWVWVWPAVVCVVSFACMCIFGTVEEKAAG